MAYITTEEVKAKRNELKKFFPSKDGWKFSITREHYTSIRVSIMKGPLELTKGSVNHYYIEEHFKETPKAAKVLNKIYTIINGGNHNNSDIMTDYHDVGFYVNLEIGKWDKEFEFVNKEVN